MRKIVMDALIFLRSLGVYLASVSHNRCHAARMPAQDAGRIIDPPVHNDPAILFGAVFLYVFAGELFPWSGRLAPDTFDFIFDRRLHPAALASPWLAGMTE